MLKKIDNLKLGIKNLILLIFLLPLALIALTCNNGGGGFGTETFRNPVEIFSSDGELIVTLTLKSAEGEVDGKIFRSRMFNDTYTPPVLRVNQGDILKLKIVNDTDQMYQDHTHGMNVTPISPGDDIFTMIMPTQSFDYEIPIPEDHPQGMFYYHSHTFGLSEFQVMSGQSGGLIVNGLLDPFPELDGIEEKIMYLKDIQIDDDGNLPPPDMIDSNARTNRVVNGLVNPTLFCQPGETQFWRMANIGADIYYKPELEGHTLLLVARDGNRTTKLIPIPVNENDDRLQDERLFGISSRLEVLVQCGEEGVYKLKTKKIDMGPDGDTYPSKTLLTLVVTGDPVEPITLPTEFPPVENLCDLVSDEKRTFVFSENVKNGTFFIDGRMFDPACINTVVEVGTIEEWTIKNDSQENHQFHIHQTDFVVCSINGEEQEFTGRQDTVNLPFKETEDDPPTEVVVVIDFTDPVICGNFVYHCHIMNHEDNGMMARILANGPLCPDIPPDGPLCP